MQHHHHHHGHDTEAPVEPGYAEHPELSQPPAPAGTAQRLSHDRMTHAGHVAAGPSGSRGGAHGGHDKHAGHSVAMFRDKFWISLLLTIPTLVWGHMLQRAFGYTPLAIPGARWIPAVFGTAVFLYGGRPFIQGAIRELRDRLPGMMTLITLAITVTFAFSVAVTLGYPGMPLWEELATLVTIMLLGFWLQNRSIMQAQGALAELAKLLPDTATRVVLDGGAERVAEVPVSALREADLVLVRPGASIPADGVVRAGSSEVTEAVVTGESRSVPKQPGDRVIAGTVNGSGSLRIELTGTGDRTTLAGIMRLVEQAQSSRSRAQALADRAAFWLTIVALAAGGITLIAWLMSGADPSYAVERLVTVLVIACPHALGLAIPLVIAISTTLGARNGLLIRDRRGLEEARVLNSIVFDKTGTLTLGEHRMVALQTTEGLGEAEALGLAAAVEQDSEHPVARTVIATARERGIPIPAVEGFQAIPGYGAEARVGGRRHLVGGPNLLRRLGAQVGSDLAGFVAQAEQRGQSVIYLFEEGRVLAAFATADAIRPESREAVSQLHRLGLEIVMLTGDAKPVAEAVARELGIDTVFAQVPPEGKAARIEELQRQGKKVGMVGDGVNDAPALVTADVGIAIGAGTDVAVEAGDVVLVRSDPRDVARIVTLSRASYRKMVENLWWASGYNVLAIPLAAGILASRGIVLSPAVGAVLMSLSTVIVAINAQLLRRARI